MYDERNGDARVNREVLGGNLLARLVNYRANTTRHDRHRRLAFLERCPHPPVPLALSVLLRQPQRPYRSLHLRDLKLSAEGKCHTRLARAITVPEKSHQRLNRLRRTDVGEHIHRTTYISWM